MKTKRGVPKEALIRLGLVLVFVVLLSVLAGLATAQEATAATPVALPRLPQPATLQAESLGGVAAQGDFAYVGHSNRLEIINVADPTAPVFVGRSVNLGEAVYDIAVRGSYAYTALGGSGFLKVLDISNPVSPVVVGSYEARGSAESIALAGNNVYMTDSVGLLIINVSDPSIPTLIGSYHFSPTASSTSVAVAGDYAYVTDLLASTMFILNIANPATPTLVSQFRTGGWASDVTISGSFAYVMTWVPSAVEIINIANPAAPVQVGSYPYAGAKGIHVSGNYAYTAAGDSFRVVNIANPAAPTLIGSYGPLSTWDMAVNGDYAYVTGDGLSIIHIANPAVPNRVGFYSAIDTTSPTLTWIEPVSATQVAVAHGQLMQLRVEATDERELTKVVFRLWGDHPTQPPITLAEVTSPPYTHIINTIALNVGRTQVNATAYDAAGNFDDEFIWISLEPPPAPVLDAIVNPDRNSSYTVSWKPIARVYGYKVDENWNNGAWSQIYSGFYSSIAVTARRQGPWCYRVRAFGKAGDGPWSSPACTLVVDAANLPPHTPSNPDPLDGETNVSVVIVIHWSGGDPNGDPTTYELYFDTINPPLQVVPMLSEYQYDPPGSLSFGTTYYWQVVASDVVGAVTRGPVWSFTTQPVPPELKIVFVSMIAGSGGVRAPEGVPGSSSATDWTTANQQLLQPGTP